MAWPRCPTGGWRFPSAPDILHGVAKLRDIKRAFRALGGDCLKPKAGGSHWKLRRDGKTYPIPAHNGEKTEVQERYIVGLCRCFGIDEAELRRHM